MLANLKTVRRQRGIKQADLAVALGVHKDTVSKWEGATHRRSPNGNSPTPQNLEALCRILQCPPEELLEQPDASARETADRQKKRTTSGGDSNAVR